MRVTVFILFAYAFACLQIGLGDLFETGGVQPEWLFVLMVYVAAMTPARTALWSAIGLGLLSDLMLALGSDGAVLYLIGPHALGYALGATLVLQIRTMLFRQHAVSVMLMVFLSALAANLVTIFLISVRHLLGVRLGVWTEFQWSPTDELVARFLMVLYTTALAFPVSWVLIRLGPLFSFEVHPQFLHVRGR